MFKIHAALRPKNIKKTLLLGGQKGGTGKSTIAINLALMAKAMGRDVCLIDTDKQGSSFNFMNYRKNQGLDMTPHCIQLYGADLHQEIDRLSQQHDIVIVDAGGHDSVELRSALVCQSISDFYTPVVPSAMDLSTLHMLNELVDTSKNYNPNLATHVIMNQCPTHYRVKVASDASDLVKGFEGFQVCPVKLSNRIALQYACNDLQSLVEYQEAKIRTMPYYQALGYNIKASNEIASLYRSVFGEDKKNTTHKKPLECS